MADIKFDLLFGAKSSEAVIREIRKIASEFTNLDKMSKNIGKMGGGTQGLLGKLFSGGRDDFGKTLLGSEQATKRFTAVMAAASKSVEGDYAKSLDIARKKLADMSVATERLLKGQDLLNRTMERAKQSGNIHEANLIGEEIDRGSGLIKRNSKGMRRLAGVIQSGDDQMGGGLGSLAGKMGMSVGGIGTIAAVATYVGQAIAKDIWNNPNKTLNFESERGQRFGRMYMGAVNGDFSNLMGYNAIQNDPSKRADYGTLNSGWRRNVHSAGGLLSGAWHRDMQEIGMALSGETANNAVMDAQQAQVEKETNRNPYRKQAWGMLGGFRGRMGQLRALGVGGDFTGSGIMNLQEIQNSIPNFSLDELATAKQSIEGLGQRGGNSINSSSMQLAKAVLNAQAGGLTGAAQFTGLMGRFSPGTGANFLRSASVMAGSGGVDVATANALASFTGQQASQYGVYTGENAGQGMLGMLGFGAAKNASGRLVAEQNMSGAGAFQGLLSGSKDAYQQARNLQIAVGAAPGAGILAQDYLSKNINLSNFADVMSGRAGLSGVARAGGISKGMFQNTGRGIMSSVFDRMINDPMMANTTAGRVTGSMASSGLDPTSWFKKNTGKGGAFKKSDAIEGFAFSLLESGQADSEQQALGLARDMFGLGKAATTGGKGAKGVGDVAAGTVEEKQAAVEIKNLGDMAKYANGQLSEWTKVISASRAVIQYLQSRQEQGLGEPDPVDIQNVMNRAMGLPVVIRATADDFLPQASE